MRGINGKYILSVLVFYWIETSWLWAQSVFHALLSPLVEWPARFCSIIMRHFPHFLHSWSSILSYHTPWLANNSLISLIIPWKSESTHVSMLNGLDGSAISARSFDYILDTRWIKNSLMFINTKAKSNLKRTITGRNRVPKTFLNNKRTCRCGSRLHFSLFRVRWGSWVLPDCPDMKISEENSRKETRKGYKREITRTIEWTRCVVIVNSGARADGSI